MSLPRAACAAVLLAACRATAPVAAPEHAFEFVERHMGCQARIVLCAPHEAGARDAARAAFAAIARADALLSDYREDSLASEIGAHAGDGTWIAVPDDVAELCARARELHGLTGGVFDVTIGPLVALWREARAAHALPDAAELERARKLVDARDLLVERSPSRARLARAGMALDFGGIGKGWAADAALAVLRERGVPRALVQIEGDIALGDAPSGSAGWLVGAAGGAQTLCLSNCAVSTSGDEARFVELAGVRYSHIVDPRGGTALTHSARVTVVAPDATSADALATGISVVAAADAQAGVELARRFDGAQACIEPGAGIGNRRETEGYSLLLAPARPSERRVGASRVP